MLMMFNMKLLMIAFTVAGVLATPRISISSPAPIQEMTRGEYPSTFKVSFPDDPGDSPFARKYYTVFFSSLSEQTDIRYFQAASNMFRLGHAKYADYTRGVSQDKFVSRTQTIYPRSRTITRDDIASKVYVGLPPQLPWRIVQDTAAILFTGPRNVFFDGQVGFKATIWRGNHESIPGIQPVGIIVVGQSGWQAHEDAIEWALEMSGNRDKGMVGVRQPDGSTCVGVRCKEIEKVKESRRTKCGRKLWRFWQCRRRIFRSDS